MFSYLVVSLNSPPFLGMSDQMSGEFVIKTIEIVGLRIHVERAINKVKNFLIFEGVIPLSQFGIVNQMWWVFVILYNFQDLIISAWWTFSFLCDAYISEQPTDWNAWSLLERNYLTGPPRQVPIWFIEYIPVTHYHLGQWFQLYNIISWHRTYFNNVAWKK